MPKENHHYLQKLALLFLGGMFIVTLFWYFNPKDVPTKSYSEWLQDHQKEFHPLDQVIGKSDEFSSAELEIKGIQRSMQGPYDLKPIHLNKARKELIWLTGYKTSMVDAEGNPVSDGYMCHNNLNIRNKLTSPWVIKTHGSNIRLFTLTEGQTELRLPPGFGIPIKSSQELEVVSQVLNHNEPNAELKVHQKTAIEYVVNWSAHSIIKPLYQQAVFITKQTDGPVGDFGSNLLCNAYEIDSTNLEGQQPNAADTAIQTPYNPYVDTYGRNYTGHWKINPGREVLVTDVTPMLNLPFDTHIHYMGAHLHPFGESLSLVDATTGDTLHTIHAKNHSDKIGLSEIETYSSVEGIPVYKSHDYHLVSSYNCTDSVGNHTAMATLFLFLHDKE